MAEIERYDIVIVGSGMVGLTLACLLDISGMRIAIVEARPAPEGQQNKTGQNKTGQNKTGQDEEGFDLRVSAITRGSERVFDTAGAWEGMQRRRVSPFREMRVWDAAGGSIHFDSADIDEDRLGHIIENRVIEAALREQLQSRSNVIWHRPAELQALDPGAESISAILGNGLSLKANLVVGADGADSRVRVLAGLRTRGWSYEQRALVANVRTSKSHGDTAWQVFLSTGPLAFLPLPQNHSAIVWSTTPAHAEHLLKLDDDAFLAELQLAFGTRLGRMLSTGPRAAYPLRMLHALNYVAPRIALTGDAAHTIHPLAGQGVNLGVLDVAVLAQVLAEGVALGKDPGSLLLLRRYERWRKGENLTMLIAMEAFHRVFRSEIAPLRWLRSRGLDLTDALTPVKAMLMRHAMGLSGDLPAAAKPVIA